ncbi:MAG TPA: heme ABC transporter ATP-binding protein [Candidatus Polarisedimenticolaceae bacterium]|nr:heme ABC transporter ATP-binding protein [Candidatus Polarisedimenticolaceae bacterium]
MSAEVAVRDLGAGYGGRTVLADVAFEARAGEVLGVIGPNGSGKSTLVRVLSGVLAYRGSARLAGREVGSFPRRELARLLAVVPQEPSFGFPFSALEVALMGRHPHLGGLEFESAADVALARDALARCGVAELASRSILELSSGERQRVVFARALCQQPRILLLDEPASFLDIRHQVELCDLVRELAAGGATVLAVLHDLNLAAEYCDRLVLLRAGRVAAAGPTAEVLSYANLREVFETDVYVDTNVLTGKLLVVPLPGRIQRRPPPEER